MVKRFPSVWMLVCLNWLLIFAPACDALSPDKASPQHVEPVAPPTGPAEATAGLISFFQGLAKAVRDHTGDCAAIATALNQHLDAHPDQIKLFHAMVANEAPPWHVSQTDRNNIETAMMESLSLFQNQVERCAGHDDVLEASRRLLAPDAPGASP